MYGNNLEQQKELSDNLSKKANTFFYGDFNVWQVNNPVADLDAGCWMLDTRSVSSTLN